MAASWIAGIFAGGMSALILPAAGHAQIVDQYFPTNVPGYDQSVLGRARPEYAPSGVRVGSFNLLPSLSEGLGYDDNILGSSNGKRGSLLVDTRASLSANSDWSRDSVGADLTVDDTRYPDQNSLSYTNWTASLGGALDIGRDQATASYSHLSLHQLGSDIDSQGITQPVPYTDDNVRLGYRTTFGRISLLPSFTFSAFRFSNVASSGSTLDEKVNDRDAYVGELETRYELAPQRNVLLVVRSGTNQYLRPTNTTPNNAGFSVLAGLDYTADAVIRYRALVGYSYRSYSSSITSSRSAPTAEASAIWTPTGLTTVTGTLSRRIEDALSAGIIGYTYNEARLVVDHEYRRDVLLEALGSIQYAEYTNGGGNQTIGTVGGSVQWLLNRNAQLVASYYFTAGNGSSTTTNAVTNTTTANSFSGGSYTRNIALLTLRLQL
jgi:hypothetical protein